MIYVNGKAGEIESGLKTTTPYASRVAGCVSPDAPPLPDWSNHSNGVQNSLRIGNVSNAGFGALFPRNYSTDMTVDEFYLWQITDGGTDFNAMGSTAGAIEGAVKKIRTQGAEIFKAGRYYLPTDDAVFTSAPIYFKGRERKLVPANNAGTITGASGVSLPRTPNGTQAAGPQPPARIIGVSWTWYPEAISRLDGKPIVFDHKSKAYGANPTNPYSGGGGTKGGGGIKGGDDGGGDGGGDGGADEPDDSYNDPYQKDNYPLPQGTLKYSHDLQAMAPKVLKQEWGMCSIVLRSVNAATREMKKELAGPGGMGFLDCGFSLVVDPSTGISHLPVGDQEALEYEVRFKISGLEQDSVLLGSPVFDDITIFFIEDDIEYLAWRVVNTAT